MSLGHAGQLAGSITAAAWASLPAPTPASWPSHTPAGPPFAMLLLAAALLEAAGRLGASMQCSQTLSDLTTRHKKSEPDKPTQSDQAVSTTGQSSSHRRRETQLTERSSAHGPGVGSLRGAWQGGGQLVEGFWLIAKSGYLCHVCLHFVLHYLVSTFFYFEKTLVVASGGGSASQRVATFATINSMSAGAVALIQLTATVHHAALPRTVMFYALYKVISYAVNLDGVRVDPGQYLCAWTACHDHTCTGKAKVGCISSAWCQVCCLCTAASSWSTVIALRFWQFPCLAGSMLGALRFQCLAMSVLGAFHAWRFPCLAFSMFGTSHAWPCPCLALSMLGAFHAWRPLVFHAWRFAYLAMSVALHQQLEPELVFLAFDCCCSTVQWHQHLCPQPTLMLLLCTPS